MISHVDAADKDVLAMMKQHARGRQKQQQRPPIRGEGNAQQPRPQQQLATPSSVLRERRGVTVGTIG